MSRVTSLSTALILAAAAFLPLSAQAQDAQPAQAPAAAAPAEPAAPEPAPTHLAASMEFLATSKATKGFEEMIPQFLDQIRQRFVTQRPEIAQIINDSSFSLIPEFVKRRDDLNVSLGKLYTTKFSEDELKQLTEFYKSPIGQKLAQEQVKVLAESVPVVQKWSRSLSEDMVKRVKEEVAKKGQKL